MLDTALCYFTGFIAICFGDKANKYSRESQESQVRIATKKETAAWLPDE